MNARRGGVDVVEQDLGAWCPVAIDPLARAGTTAYRAAAAGDTGSHERLCRTCGEWLPADTAFFYFRGDCRGQLHTRCRCCVLERCRSSRKAKPGPALFRHSSGDGISVLS